MNEDRDGKELEYRPPTGKSAQNTVTRKHGIRKKSSALVRRNMASGRPSTQISTPDMISCSASAMSNGG